MYVYFTYVTFVLSNAHPCVRVSDVYNELLSLLH
jgi:hypothetical protein